MNVRHALALALSTSGSTVSDAVMAASAIAGGIPIARDKVAGSVLPLASSADVRAARKVCSACRAS